MSLALVRNAEVSYVGVEFYDRDSDALFLLEVTVHHHGDTIVWPGIMFPPDWRAILRHCHVDVYGALAERWFMLATRWAFLRSRVVHATGCTTNKCAVRYGLKDATFYCARCGRQCGYCFGASDDHPEYCDDCWSDAETIFDLTRVRRVGSTARAVALREAAYLGAGEEWAWLEALDIELRRAVVAEVVSQ